LIELLAELNVNERAGAVPDLETVVNAEARGERGGHEETTVGCPFEVRGARSIDSADPVQGAAIEDVGLASKVTVSSEEHKTTLRVERDGVVRC